MGTYLGPPGLACFDVSAFSSFSFSLGFGFLPWSFCLRLVSQGRTVCGRRTAQGFTSGKGHTFGSPKVPMKSVLRISRASSEWPTSSKDSVASLPITIRCQYAYDGEEMPPIEYGD